MDGPISSWKISSSTCMLSLHLHIQNVNNNNGRKLVAAPKSNTQKSTTQRATPNTSTAVPTSPKFIRLACRRSSDAPNFSFWRRNLGDMRQKMVKPTRMRALQKTKKRQSTAHYPTRPTLALRTLSLPERHRDCSCYLLPPRRFLMTSSGAGKGLGALHGGGSRALSIFFSISSKRSNVSARKQRKVSNKMK